MTDISLEEIITVQSALADSSRVRIIRLLLEGELCVCELMRVLCEPQSKVSRHLGILKRAGLVRCRREGTWMHYQIVPTLANTWQTALQSLSQVWDQSAEIQADLVRLRNATMQDTGESVCWR